MTIIQRIAAIISNLGYSPAIPFIVGGTKEWGNMLADKNTVYPLIFCLSLPKTKDVIQKSGIVTKTSPMILFFCNMTKLTDTPLQQQTVIAPLELMKDTFLRAATLLRDANGLLYFNSITNIQSEQVINLFDKNVSGILMAATFEPLENQTNICV